MVEGLQGLGVAADPHLARGQLFGQRSRARLEPGRSFIETDRLRPAPLTAQDGRLHPQEPRVGFDSPTGRLDPDERRFVVSFDLQREVGGRAQHGDRTGRQLHRPVEGASGQCPPLVAGVIAVGVVPGVLGRQPRPGAGEARIQLDRPLEALDSP